MRMLFGFGGQRSLQGLRALLQTAWNHLERLMEVFNRPLTAPVGYGPWGLGRDRRITIEHIVTHKTTSATGC
jgi:hypothetical protein